MKMSSFGDTENKEPVLKDSKKKKAAYAIDLGTTNSCIAICKGVNSPEIVRLDEGVTMPSCVLWKGATKFVVGKEAYNNRYRSNAIYSVKRLIGSEELVSLQYGVSTKTMTPTEVSCEILKALVKKASSLYKDIEDVVITVPAYFNNVQVKETIRAGEMAGLNVLGIVREPTAAAMNYRLPEDKKSEVVLVYDLGGGTFDITLMRISWNKNDEDNVLSSIYDIDVGDSIDESSQSVVYNVLDTNGDTRLGGDDIDLAMYEIVLAKMRKSGVDVDNIPSYEKEKILLSLEGAKKFNPDMYTLKLDIKLGGKPSKRFKGDIVLYKEDFEAAAKVVYRKTKKLVDSVLRRLPGVVVDSIVLVGGSTKSPHIREFLKKDFPTVRINSALNPDESVALGASIKAKEIKFGDTNTEVFDVIPIGIGVWSDNQVRNLIKRGQRVPHAITEDFQTSADDQTSVRVDIYQGDSPLKEEGLLLHSLTIGGLPRKPAGEVTVWVTMSLDTNGVLSCKVRAEDQTKSAVIVNLFDSREQEQPIAPKKQDRRVIKWRGLANSLETEKKKRLLLAIDEFESGLTASEQVVDLINELVHVDLKVRDKVDLEQPKDSEE